MLRAYAENQRGCIAWLTAKTEGPFVCPGCQQEVVLHKGTVVTHHFAHKVKGNCTYGKGESPEHMATKKQIYDILLQTPGCTDCELERWVGGDVRPDVSFKYRGSYIAVEVQRSDLAVGDIIRRTEAYTKRGWYIIWLSPPPRPVGEFVVPKWERFLHTMYFGERYYWNKDHIDVVTLKSVERYVPEREWYDTETQGHRKEGGYYKTLKFTKNAEVVKSLVFPVDFCFATRDPFEVTNRHTIPAGNVFRADCHAVDLGTRSQQWWFCARCDASGMVGLLSKKECPVCGKADQMSVLPYDPAQRWEAELVAEYYDETHNTTFEPSTRVCPDCHISFVVGKNKGEVRCLWCASCF